MARMQYAADDYMREVFFKKSPSISIFGFQCAFSTMVSVNGTKRARRREREMTDDRLTADS